MPWAYSSSGHDVWTLDFSPGDEELAEAVLKYAEATCQLVKDKLDWDMQPVTIHLARPPRDDYSRDYASQRDRAWFDPVMLRDKDPRLQFMIIAHELIHSATYQIMGITAKELPNWFYEGLAVYLSGYDQDLELRGLKEEGLLVAMHTLRYRGRPKGLRAKQIYAQGWYAVQRIEELTGSKTIGEFLKMAGELNDWKEAFRITIGFTFEEWEEKMDEELNS